MKITDIKIFSVSGEIEARWSGEERSARPIDFFAGFAEENVVPVTDPNDKVPVTNVYIEIITDEEVSGIYGPIVYQQQTYIIHTMLRPFLIGKDPLQTELLWNQMRYIDRHAGSGMIMMAISAVDCALWDLKGKYYNEPVYRLLGGPTRDKIKAYASCLAYSVKPEETSKKAEYFVQQGYTAQKWFFRYGPASGKDGVEKNIALASAVREAVGPIYELMFDCWMGWDTQYSIDIGKELEQFTPKWLEEPLLPDEIDGYKQLSKKMNVPLSAGEHLYTRWGFKPFLEHKILQYIQPDPDWTGGITEIVKIGHMAETYGVQMIPHGCTVVAAAHVIAAFSPKVCPYIEYLIKYQERQQHFHKDPLRPVDGYIYLPNGPGLGIELDEGKYTTKKYIF